MVPAHIIWHVCMHWCVCAWIQITSFLMTLRRKNIISHNTWVAAYGALLVFNFAPAALVYYKLHVIHMGLTLGCMAALLRIGVGLNKYLVWSVIAIIVHFVRSTTTPGPTFDTWQTRWVYLDVLALVATVSLGVYKSYVPRQSAP